MQKPDMLVYYKLEMAGVSHPLSALACTSKAAFLGNCINVHGVQVSPQLCKLLSDVSPSPCSASAVERLFTRLSSCKPCIIGNPDQQRLTLRLLKG